MRESSPKVTGESVRAVASATTPTAAPVVVRAWVVTSPWGEVKRVSVLVTVVAMNGT